jgi:SSS family solute:Na+ symporter
MLFDFMTTATGLYAAAILPDLANAVESYPQLAAKILPPLARGLFFLALFATIMSTIDGYAFLSGITIGKDLLGKIWGRNEDRLVTRFSRLGLILTFIFAAGLALRLPSVVDIWYGIGTLTTSALLVPLATSFSEKWKMPPRWALFSMLTSATVSGVWMLTVTNGEYWLGLQPIYPGLATSAGCFVLSLAFSRYKNSII